MFTILVRSFPYLYCYGYFYTIIGFIQRLLEVIFRCKLLKLLFQHIHLYVSETNLTTGCSLGIVHYW